MGHPSRTDNRGWEFKIPPEPTGLIWTGLKFSRPCGTPLGTVVLTQTLNHPNLDKSGSGKPTIGNALIEDSFRGEGRERRGG